MSDNATQADKVIGGKKGKAKAEDAGPTVEELQAKVTELEGSISAYKGQVTKAENALAARDAEIAEALVKRKLATRAEADDDGFDPLGALFKAYDDTLAECNSAKRSLRAQKGATTKAKGEVEALEEAAKPRALGPVEDQPGVAELAEFLAETPAVEIAFSDGKAELAGLAPVQVKGSAFVMRRGRLWLSVEKLTIRGPADDKPPRALNGYALLVEGEQVAWAPRLAGQLTLGAGNEYDVAQDIVLT